MPIGASSEAQYGTMGHPFIVVAHAYRRIGFETVSNGFAMRVTVMLRPTPLSRL